MQKNILYFISLILLFTACMLAFNNKLKQKVFSYFKSDKKVVLTTLSADLNNSGSPYKIVKIKHHNGIYLDVFKFISKEKIYQKVDSIKLKYKHDGFYKFGKEATNLFTTDLNNDGILEIIAPTHTPQLKPHLNIVNLNPKTNLLEFSQQTLFNF